MDAPKKQQRDQLRELIESRPEWLEKILVGCGWSPPRPADGEQVLFPNLYSAHPDGWWFVTREELSAFGAIDVKTINRWQRSKKFPKGQGKDKAVDIRAAVKWLCDRYKEREEAAPQSDSEFRTPWEREKTLKARLDREITAGRYVDAEERLEQETAALHALALSLSDLGRALAPSLESMSDRSEIEDLIRRTVDERRAALAKDFLLKAEDLAP